MKLLEMVKENDQLNLKGLVDSGIYESEDEILHDALNMRKIINERMKKRL
jgi:Arc/MetJ-type ribon-helix-helix transcriptional regulator